MNLKVYQNELIVAAAFLVMIIALLYREGRIDTQKEQQIMMQNTISEFKEVIVLQNIWGDQKLNKRVDSLKSIAPASKVTWSKKRSQVIADYKELSARELNNLAQRVLNLGVQIKKLDIQKSGELYNVGLKCEW